jgi:S1-C subfamily serine protease
MSNPATAPLQQYSDALAAIVAQAAPSIVAVLSHRSRASGFFWRPGLIVTADEALADDGEISVVLPGGESVAATLIGRDPTTDVALLKVDRPAAPVAPLETAISLRAGALALAVGAEGGAPSAAVGAVAFVGEAWRSLRGGEIDARIELDLSLRRHSEGALALDAAGRAFGMVVFGPRRRALVIPAPTIARVATKLESHGRVPRGYLGLGLRTTRLDGEAGTGVIVMNVEANGPGAAAGLRQGDIIVKWNGEPARDVRTLMRALGPESVGKTASLSLLRAGQPTQATLTIGERPEA